LGKSWGESQKDLCSAECSPAVIGDGDLPKYYCSKDGTCKKNNGTWSEVDALSDNALGKSWGESQKDLCSAECSPLIQACTGGTLYNQCSDVEGAAGWYCNNGVSEFNCTQCGSKCPTGTICNQTNQKCVENTSTTSDCTANTEKRCSGDILQKCNSTGTGWVTDTDCGTVGCNGDTKVCSTATTTTTATTATTATTTQPCTSISYSSWSACVNGVQTRTVIIKQPSNNCVGGVQEVLSQSCCATGAKECVTATSFRECVGDNWGITTGCSAAKPLCVDGLCQARASVDSTINIKMAFAGVKPGSDQCATTLWPTSFKMAIAGEVGDLVVGLKSAEIKGIPQKTTAVNSKGEIIYNFSASVSGVSDAGVNSLAFFMKGPKHISLKYGVNEQTAWYQDYVGRLNLVAGGNSYDFSNYSLLAGDVTGSTVGVADGKIDGRDFSFIKGKSQPITSGPQGVSLVGDIDGNCQVNAGDVRLIKQSLIEINSQTY
jgi:hypothetical protein